MPTEHKIVISIETVREISRQLATMQSYFKELKDSYINDSVDNASNWTSASDLDMAFKPENYYYLRFGNKYVKIWHMRNKFYTLECFGFEPKDYPYFDQDKILDNEFYRTLYGKWSDFGEALNAFANVCREMTEFHTRPLF